MSLADEVKTLETLLQRLTIEARTALLQYQKQTNIPDAHIRALAILSGRGYRPPVEPDDWHPIYEMLVKYTDLEDERL